MPTTPTPKPLTYDEITRRTVPEPDSSFRPSPEQVRQAFAGHRELDVDETALRDRVMAALAAAALETGGVTVEVTRDRVALHGKVKDAATMSRIADVVRDAGVRELDDHLVIG